MANRLRQFMWALLFQCGAVLVASAAAPVVIPPGYVRVEVPAGLSVAETAKAARAMMLVAAFRSKTTPYIGVVVVERRSGRVVGSFTKNQMLEGRPLPATRADK